MKIATLIIAAFLICSAARAQAPTPAISPKQVIEAYWKLETSGARLTPEGWARAAMFFQESAPFPSQVKIYLIDPRYSVWPPFERTDRVDVNIGLFILGTISPDLKYEDYDDGTIKQGVFFTLMRASDTSWKINAKPRNEIWLPPDVAFNYVTRMREKTGDPIAKRNAAKTLQRLDEMVKHGGDPNLQSPSASPCAPVRRKKPRC